MTLLPILGRELRGQARNRATYWTRSAVALVGVLICVQSMGVGSFTAAPFVGRIVFNIVLGTAFLMSCSACLLTADSISAERREGTLDLLFATDVRPLDILLGKLGSVGITGLCALLAFSPILMIPLLGGGVTAGEVVRKGLVLMNTLFLALAAGLFASSGQQEKSRAVRWALVFMALSSIIPWFSFAAAAGHPHYFAYCFGLFSPLVSLVSAGSSVYVVSKGTYWVSLVMIQCLTWSLLFGTVARLRLLVSNPSEDLAGREVRLKRESDCAVGLGTWEPVKGEAAPVEWLTHRKYGVNAGMWATAVLGLAYSGWVLLLRDPLGTPKALASWFFAWPLGVTVGLVGAALLASAASRFFVGVRQSGDLELLLTTPVGAETLLSDQWIVLRRFFVWPVLLLQAPLIPQLVVTLLALRTPAADASPVFLVFYRGLVLANTVVGTATLCWLAMWFGLKGRTQASAVVWAAGLVKALPALLSLICFVLAESALPAASRGGLVFRAGAVALALATWVPELAALVFYVWLLSLARRRLLADLSGAPLGSMTVNVQQSFSEALQLLRARP